MRSTKLTIYEAQLAVYPSDLTDLVTGPALFIAEYVEKMTLTRSYEEKRRPFMGRAYQESYNADETHMLELDAALQVGPLAELKSLDRFGRYIAVIVWHDEEAMVWMKRTYYGVTPGTAQASGEAIYEKENLRAERMVLTTGKPAWPDLLPDAQFGMVVYVKDTTRIPLYSYSGTDKSFSPLATFDASKGQILPISGTLKFFIEGVLSMVSSPSGTLVANLIATGGSYYDSPLARIEFDINGARAATLGKDGTLAIPDLTEADTAPGFSTDIELRPLGTWAGSIGVAGMTSPTFSEFL